MTVRITVLGVVQGVGYRPFVARLANKLNIAGTVMNSGGIVQIVAEGEKQAIDRFIAHLKQQEPEGADVVEVLTQRLPDEHFEGFHIIASMRSEEETPRIPADLPMCESCNRELHEPLNRRYRYPFISCVSCGPRYSIMDTLPYDRENTTMHSFPLCESCENEYDNSGNIRCYAQTIACHDCGPQLILKVNETVLYKEEALKKAVDLLKNGKVIAIKGIGGYQFACLPYDSKAVGDLRLLKLRDKKPFAVMFPDMQAVKENCEVNEREEQLLLSSARPIVLLNPKENGFCDEVCCESRFIGAFLPYTPLHQLLTEACGALVMTSGNITGEPIITKDEDIFKLNSAYLAGILYNTRQIVTPLDDSVVKEIGGRVQIIRRSRGYVPLPVSVNKSTIQPVLAMGGDLKSCFCLFQNDRAYISQYFGDIENYSVSEVYRDNLKRMESLFGIHPAGIACDLHPGYYTSILAEKLAGEKNSKLIKIQHHYAHVASVMAEHNLSNCIGVAFDGTGYGTDGAVWGGEFLLCKAAGFERCGHLEYVSLCGGDEAAKNAELTAYGYLNAAGEALENSQFSLVKSAVENKVNTQQSSSMGRLFDAVCALLKIKTINSFEGECAITLENLAAKSEEKGIKPYPLYFDIQHGKSEIVCKQISLFKDIFEAYNGGIDVGSLALGFHKAIAEMVLAVCTHIRSDCGENTVALSGGVFANELLTRDCLAGLENAGFSVYINSEVPANDGGLCLGQAWICGQMQ